MEEFAFHRALTSLWEFVSVVNRYVDATQPWALAKDAGKRDRLSTVLGTLAESLRVLGVVLAPFLPEAAAKIRAALGQKAEHALTDATWGRLAPGTAVQKVSGLFPRVDTKPAPAGDQPTADGAAASPTARPRIKIDEFGKVELRVAEVIAAEALSKSKKLLKLTVKVGEEQRTVVAGIAEHYAPADLVGKKVVVVANLEPARLMGVESNGMLLAGSSGGSLAVLVLDRDLPPGARVK
jgi:methionyl-tRNA synthetase